MHLIKHNSSGEYKSLAYFNSHFTFMSLIDCRARWVEVEGVRFNKQTVVVTGWDIEEDDPKFGKVIDIYTTHVLVLFLVKRTKTS